MKHGNKRRRRWVELPTAPAAEGPQTALLLCTSVAWGLATWRSNPQRTDPGKVRQILYNLIGKAAKFTRKRQITVTVHWDRSTSADLQVHVRETGPGIAPEEQERIFEPFTQADSS